MATEFLTDKEKEEETGPITSQGAGGTTLTTAGGGSPTSAPQQQRQGTGLVTNVKQYINANQGAGQELASGITKGVERKAGAFNKDLESTKNQFGQQTGQIESQLGDQGKELVNTSFKDPQALLQQQDKLSQFQKLRDQGYNQDIQNISTDTSKLAQQQKALADAAQTASSEEGRFQLLNQTYQQPGYSRGAQNLDQLFLQAGAGNTARQLQSNLSGIANTANQNLASTSDEMSAKINALKDMTGQRAEEIKNLFTQGTTEGFDQDLTGRGFQDISQSAQQAFDAANAKAATLPELQKRLASGKLTEQDLQDLGLSAGMNLYNTKLDQFISPEVKQATNLAQTANADEFARYQALRQLAGDSLAGADIFGGATEAGGFSPWDYRNDDLNAAIKAAGKKAEAAKSTDQFGSGLDWVKDPASMNRLLQSELFGGEGDFTNMTADQAELIAKNADKIKEIYGDTIDMDDIYGADNNPYRQLGSNGNANPYAYQTKDIFNSINNVIDQYKKKYQTERKLKVQK